MTKVIFNRKDATVQADATSLSLEDFQAKYKDQAQAIVLKTVWTAANKGKATTAAVTAKTDEATSLPATPAKEEKDPTLETHPVQTGFTAEDGAEVSVKRNPATGAAIVEIDNEPKAGKVKKSKKDTTTDTPAEAPAKDASRPSRAERLRALIAAGNDKKASTAILVTEGYDVKTIHSEWNRLSKPAAK